MLSVILILCLGFAGQANTQNSMLTRKNTCHLPSPSPCANTSISCEDGYTLVYDSSTAYGRADDSGCSPIDETKCNSACCNGIDGSTISNYHDWDTDYFCTGKNYCDGIANTYWKQFAEYPIIQHTFVCFRDDKFLYMKDNVYTIVDSVMFGFFSHLRTPAKNWTCSCELTGPTIINVLKVRLSETSCKGVEFNINGTDLISCGESRTSYLKTGRRDIDSAGINITFRNFYSVPGDYIGFLLHHFRSPTFNCTGCVDNDNSPETDINLPTTTTPSNITTETPSNLTTGGSSNKTTETGMMKLVVQEPCLKTYDETTKDIVLISAIGVLVLTYAATFIGFVWKFDKLKSVA